VNLEPSQYERGEREAERMKIGGKEEEEERQI
jgi:hypothetical protein